LPVYELNWDFDEIGTPHPRDFDTTATTDFSATFRAGYSSEDHLVYVALEVVDDDAVSAGFFGGDSDNSWLVLRSHQYDRPAHYYRLEFGEEAALHHPDHWALDQFTFDYFARRRLLATRSRGVLGRSDRLTTYEWVFDLCLDTDEKARGTGLQPGQLLDFQIVVYDADSKDDERGILGWDSGLGRWRVHGHLLLAAAAADVASVSGQVTDAGTGAFLEGVRVAIRLDDTSQSYVTYSDDDGRYDAFVLPGAYRVEIVGVGDSIAVEVDVAGGEERVEVDLAVSGYRPATHLMAADVESEYGVSLAAQRYKVGDDASWAGADLDDSGWAMGATKYDSEAVIAAGEALWHRYHLDVDPALWRTPLALRGWLARTGGGVRLPGGEAGVRDQVSLPCTCGFTAATARAIGMHPVSLRQKIGKLGIKVSTLLD
jgi:hypothetical protein